MGGHVSKTLDLQSRRDDEKFAREQLLERKSLYLNRDSLPWIVDHIDCFVSQSRGNRSVEHVYLCPHAQIDIQDYAIWNKVGQAIGYLQALDIYRNTRSLQLTDDEDKQMASLLQKNCALESFPDIKKERARDVGAILRLNGA
jgi:hypothetical protein